MLRRAASPPPPQAPKGRRAEGEDAAMWGVPRSPSGFFLLFSVTAATGFWGKVEGKRPQLAIQVVAWFQLAPQVFGGFKGTLKGHPGHPPFFFLGGGPLNNDTPIVSVRMTRL